MSPKVRNAIIGALALIGGMIIYDVLAALF